MKKDLEVLTSTRMMPFQFFREWLVEACVRSGIKKRKDLPLPWAVKVAIAKLGLCFPLHKKKKLLFLFASNLLYCMQLVALIGLLFHHGSR